MAQSIRGVSLEKAMEKSTENDHGMERGTEADRAAAAEARAPAWGGQRVLLVDDNEAICEVLLLALTDAGFAVTCAHDTAAARKALNWSGFDVVVLDVNMPGESGLSLADYAAALGAAVIFITGRSEHDDHTRSARPPQTRQAVSPRRSYSGSDRRRAPSKVANRIADLLDQAASRPITDRQGARADLGSSVALRHRHRPRCLCMLVDLPRSVE